MSRIDISNLPPLGRWEPDDKGFIMVRRALLDPQHPLHPMFRGEPACWGYAWFDLVGMARRHYAANMRSIRVMCSSRVEPEFVLETLRDGADGVLILGCHPGECHYVDGNLRTLRRFLLLKKVLRQLGVEDERVQLEWTGASEGSVLAATVDRMTEDLRALGPLRWADTVLADPQSDGVIR